MKVFNLIILLLYVIKNVEGIVDNCYLYHMSRGCKSVDVRYNHRNLEILRNCGRIYGDLKISDMNFKESYRVKDGNVTKKYENVFPELVEITGFLRIDNVKGLTSLNTLFPKLAIIYGETLWNETSIMITKCPDLESFNFNTLVFAGKNIINAKIIGSPKIGDSSIVSRFFFLYDSFKIFRFSDYRIDKKLYG